MMSPPSPPIPSRLPLPITRGYLPPSSRRPLAPTDPPFLSCPIRPIHYLQPGRPDSTLPTPPDPPVGTRRRVFGLWIFSPVLGLHTATLLVLARSSVRPPPGQDPRDKMGPTVPEGSPGPMGRPQRAPSRLTRRSAPPHRHSSPPHSQTALRRHGFLTNQGPRSCLW